MLAAGSRARAIGTGSDTSNKRGRPFPFLERDGLKIVDATLAGRSWAVDGIQAIGSPVLRSAPPRARVGPARGRPLDVESQAWLVRLHAVEPVRAYAIAELHESLRREACFHLRWRTRHSSCFPRSDIDDLAVQAADDALWAVLHKLDDYRGDSRFLTWARRFAQLEAAVSIRRRVGRDQLGRVDPDRAIPVADPGASPHERAEAHELLQTVCDLIVNLTRRQRTIVVAIAIDGVSAGTLAAELDTTRGAIYKALYDARAKLNGQLALG